MKLDYESLNNSDLNCLVEVMKIFTTHKLPAFSDTDFSVKQKREAYLTIFESLDYYENLLDKSKFIDINDVRFFVKREKDTNLVVHTFVKLKDNTDTIEAIKAILNYDNVTLLYNIAIDTPGYNSRFETNLNAIHKVGAYYDKSLITLEGKKYRNIRLQLNRVNDDIVSGKLNKIQLPVSDLKLEHIDMILALIKKWGKTRQITSNEPYMPHAYAYMRFLQKLMKLGRLQELDMIVCTMIIDNSKNSCIAFGISEITSNLVNCNIDTKVDFEYKDRYPHLGKLINHYTAKQIIGHLKLDENNVVHTIGPEDNVPSFQDLIEYKNNRVAISHIVIFTNYSKTNKRSAKDVSRKKSIF